MWYKDYLASFPAGLGGFFADVAATARACVIFARPGEKFRIFPLRRDVEVAVHPNAATRDGASSTGWNTAA
eukprot:gene23736-biopygen5854